METKPAETKPDLAAIYTPGQLDVINSLTALQAETGLSDGKFAEKHLTVHSTTWMRLKTGTYTAEPGAALVKLETNLRQMRLERARGSKLTGGGTFHPIPSQQAVIDAVTLTKLKPDDDCERLVVFLAETGGGKTRLARELKIMHDGYLVEASEPWRTSYYAALCDIGAAIGLSEKELGTSAYTAQRTVVKKLKSQRRVLIIDEGEYFGQSTSNLIKLLLNQTPTVIVIMAIPELFARIQRTAWVESAQTNRRTEAVVEAAPIFPDDVKKFIASGFVIEVEQKGQGDACLGEIAKAANEFGRFSFVKRVVADLNPAQVVTPADVTKSIRNIKALLRRAA